MPAPCLLQIKWTPELPPEKVDAIRQLQYARITKTAVLFADRFWDNARGRNRRFGFAVFNSRVTDFCFDSTYGQKGTLGIICSYSIGDKADDIASEKRWNVKRWIRNDLREFVGVKDREAGKALDIEVQAWQKKTWRGAYAFYRPGQWFTLRPILQNPHKRVFFAGEHLSDEAQGFMEGAVQTGQDAADQL